MRPLLATILVLAACGPQSATSDSASGTSGGTAPLDSSTAQSSDSDSDPTPPTTTDTTHGPIFPDDFPDDPPTVACEALHTCNLLDILLVVDNSGSMATIQRDLAADLPALVTRLRAMKALDGAEINPDVNIMVTTTDHGNPLCAPFQKPDYTPAMGAPIATACTDRLTRFEPVVPGSDPAVPEACTDHCSPDAPAAPDGPFIHFDGFADNIVDPDGQGDPVADALACLAPQGIDGCGLESQLEAVHSALAVDAPWNQGAQPFLREGAALAIIVVSDESDCSPLDLKYFDPANADDPEVNQYWNAPPNQPDSKQPTSALCWNSSVTCEDANTDGIYESCTTEDKGVLQPLTRYTDLLADLELSRGKPVFMLNLTGVPPVSARAPSPPHVAIAGGLFDLVLRKWRDEDILPGDPKTAADHEFELGIGPGCSDSNGGRLPSPRVDAVCQSLDRPDDPNTPVDETELRCCIESLCDGDNTGALECLVSALEQTMRPPI